MAAQRQRAARHSFVQSQTLPLVVILTVQALLSLRLIWSNTAFTDEALYLWSGRLEWAHWLHATPIPNFPTYFSGSPVVYPPLGAMAPPSAASRRPPAVAVLHARCDRALARRDAAPVWPALGNFAAALFAGLGATQFLGAFATYDAMALVLLALATWLSVRAGGSRLAVQLPLLAAAAGALALADAAKYAATLFDPIVIGVAGLVAWRAGSRKNGIAAALGMTSALVLLLYLASGSAAPPTGAASPTPPWPGRTGVIGGRDRGGQPRLGRCRRHPRG